MRVEWINCLTGFRGSVETFPAELLAANGEGGAVFRFDGTSVKICPDFRTAGIHFCGKIVTTPVALEVDLPVILQMRGRIIVLCACDGQKDGVEDWASEYRFPLWTLFEPETFEPIETVRTPKEIPAALKRAGLDADECLASPYGLPVAVPLAQIFDTLLADGNADNAPDANAL